MSMPNSIREPELLAPLFSPSSVAVVGASANPYKPGGQPLLALLKNRFPGAMYPVTPTHSEIFGVPCLSRIAECPTTPDLAVIALPAHKVLQAVSECLDAGVKALVVLSSGFAEAGEEGTLLQGKLAELVQKAGVPMVGPNCLGVISGPERLNANFLIVRRQPDGLVERPFAGFVSRSGSLCASFVEDMAARRIGLSRVVSTGNEADLRTADILQYLAQDPATGFIAGYVEEIRAPELFVTACRSCVDAGKPVALLAGGMTEQGREAAGRHTSGRSLSAEETDELFSRSGAIRLESIAEAGVMASLAARGANAVRRLAVVSPFGGAGVLATDHAVGLGFDMAELASSTRKSLAELVPDFASCFNPVDVTPQGMGDPALLPRLARITAEDPAVDAVLVFVWFWEEALDEQVAGLSRLSAESRSLIMVAASGAPAAVAEGTARLHQAGVIAETDRQMLLTALSKLSGLSK